MKSRGYVVSSNGYAIETDGDEGRRSVGVESLLLATARFITLGRLDESDPTEAEITAVNALLSAAFAGR
jgi:hypothetical protein